MFSFIVFIAKVIKKATVPTICHFTSLLREKKSLIPRNSHTKRIYSLYIYI